MRIFLMIMVFAIALSGYSAAAHAFASETCGNVMAQEGHNPANCTDHTKHHKTIADQDDSGQKSGSIPCLDCHQCCAAHALSLPVITLPVPPQTKMQHVLTSFGYSDHRPLSLLRPPRNLV